VHFVGFFCLRQGTLFDFGVKKSHIEGVCDATNNGSSTSSLQSDLQDVQRGENYQHTEEKVCIHS